MEWQVTVTVLVSRVEVTSTFGPLLLIKSTTKTCGDIYEFIEIRKRPGVEGVLRERVVLVGRRGKEERKKTPTVVPDSIVHG